MPEVIEGKWDDLITREDLKGRQVKIIVVDESPQDPWLQQLKEFVSRAKPVGHFIDDSRESIYSGTIDDPR